MSHACKHHYNRTANLLGATALALSDLALDGVTQAANVSASGAAALVCLSADPGLSVTELGRRVGLSQSAAARMVDSLEADGLVERRPNPWLSRMTSVHTTGSGTQTARQVLAARGSPLTDVVGVLERRRSTDTYSLADQDAHPALRAPRPCPVHVPTMRSYLLHGGIHVSGRTSRAGRPGQVIARRRRRTLRVRAAVSDWQLRKTYHSTSGEVRWDRFGDPDGEPRTHAVVATSLIIGGVLAMTVFSERMVPERMQVFWDALASSSPMLRLWPGHIGQGPSVDGGLGWYPTSPRRQPEQNAISPAPPRPGTDTAREGRCERRRRCPLHRVQRLHILRFRPMNDDSRPPDTLDSPGRCRDNVNAFSNQ